MALLKFLVLASIFLLPTAMVLRIEMENGLAINFIDCFVLLIALYGTLYLAYKKNTQFKYLKELLLFLLVGFLSLAINQSSYQLSETLTATLHIVRYFS